MWLYLSIGNNSYFTEDIHSTWSFFWRRELLLGEKKAEKHDRLSSSLSWIPGKRDWRNNPRWHFATKKCTLQNWVATRSRIRLLDSFGQGTGKRHNILANEIACHHCSLDSTARLYRESDISEEWDDFISTTLHTTASSKNNSKNAWNQQQQQQQGDLGSCGKL